MEMKRFDEEHCVICHCGFDPLDYPSIEVGKKGIESLIKFSKRRNYKKLRSYLSKTIKNNEEMDIQQKIFVHKNCRRDFTDIKRSFQISAPPKRGSTKRLRSSMSPFSWKENCFLCCRIAIDDEKHPDRSPLVRATTINFLKTIVEKCQERNDDWGNEIETRLSCSHDLVADEGAYHKECLSRLMSNRAKPSDKQQQDLLKKFRTCESYNEIAEVFSDETALTEEIGNAGLKLFAKSYNGNSNDTLERLRYNQFMEMTATSNTVIKPQSLPPSESAAYYHSLRVHLQVIQWKSLMTSTIMPTDWGWKLVNNCYEPIKTDLEPAPENILKFIRCNCKVSTKNPCGTKVCSCKKNGLKCVVACGNCHGQQCNNSESIIYDDDNESDYDDANIFDILEDF